MCGITGFFDPSGAHSAESLQRIATAMTQTLVHRGPDDQGVWVDQEAGCALGSRRLAVQDPSMSAHQPMVSSCGGFVLAYNGEIYNFGELRTDLEAGGVTLRSRGDTEVLLEALARWGAERTLERLNGMFAFALWDRRARRLTLARDRIGIKPLYLGKAGETILFGSELKAIVRHPDFRPEIDRGVLSAYLRYGYVPGPRSIYRGIERLPPGTVAQVEADGQISTRVYWSARQVAEEGAERARTATHQSVEEMEDLLQQAVRMRMISDVPLGAFLSGGVDSSTVVSLMQAADTGPVRTFTIGFQESKFNEAPHARAVAEHLGTDHTELYLAPHDVLDIVPRMAEIYDEPFADDSQIPTFLVSKMAREHVTVALSGDGGDELFAGYDKYRWGDILWRWRCRIPSPARKGAGAMIRCVPPRGWDAFSKILPPAFQTNAFGRNMHKLADAINADSADDFFHRLTGWPGFRAAVTDAGENAEPMPGLTKNLRLPNLMDRMQYADVMTFLPDDILTKVDRASMAVGLEVRVPLLDHRVVEQAWALPHDQKFHRGVTKQVLRRVLRRHVPPEITERPKAGFGIPIDTWLRGPLKEWAEEYLTPDSLERGGLLHAAPVRELWQDHLAGRHNWNRPLWAILMLQQWRETWRV